MASTMAPEHVSEVFHLGRESLKNPSSADELVAEARLGADLARALIEHVSRMRAAGYDNEILVDGEVWIIQAERKSPAN